MGSGSLIVSTLAVAFAAFCVWLTVRIVNRRERWAKWVLVSLALAVFVLYPLSFPWVDSCFALRDIGRNCLTPIYDPMLNLVATCPRAVDQGYSEYCRWVKARTGAIEHIRRRLNGVY